MDLRDWMFVQLLDSVELKGADFGKKAADWGVVCVDVWF
jgi:hypothetical protein